MDGLAGRADTGLCAATALLIASCAGTRLV